MDSSLHKYYFFALTLVLVCTLVIASSDYVNEESQDNVSIQNLSINDSIETQDNLTQTQNSTNVTYQNQTTLAHNESTNISTNLSIQNQSIINLTNTNGYLEPTIQSKKI